jgi:hypothetical protein
MISAQVHDRALNRMRTGYPHLVMITQITQFWRSKSKNQLQSPALYLFYH